MRCQVADFLRIVEPSPAGGILEGTQRVHHHQHRGSPGKILPEIIGGLATGEEVVITQGNEPVAELRPARPRPPSRTPRFGNCRGMLTIVSEDEEHLEDFKDYMPVRVLLDTHAFL